jgi:hypothetical protein
MGARSLNPKNLPLRYYGGCLHVVAADSPSSGRSSEPAPNATTGANRSASFEAKSGAVADEGTYDPRTIDKSKLKILNRNPNVESLIDSNPHIVRHSKCAGVVHMKATNNTAFTRRLKRRKGPTKERPPTASTNKNRLTRFMNHERSASSVTHVSPSYMTLFSAQDLHWSAIRVWTHPVRSQEAGGASRHVIAHPQFDLLRISPWLTV